MNIKKIVKKFIPGFVLDFYHFFLPMFGAFLYRFPSRKLIVIGVTGTNGKSSVVNLIVKILEQGGNKVASLSSIKFKIGKKEWKNSLKMTMPGRMKLQKFLRGAVNAGCKYAVLEVTSEGIKQSRHQFINFETVVFTNLTPEHIESHGSFELYKKAKGKLFEVAKKTHIVNLDDKNAEYFLGFTSDKKIAFSLSKNGADVKAENCQVLSGSLKFSINDVEFNLNLLGKFNIYNALAAISVCLSYGVDLEICKKAVEEIKVIPGRMEVVIKEPFNVIVDYAHTPDALEKVCQASKEITEKKMICVLGSAGGGRDKWKRPEMGKIASQYCDKIILTNEDSYDEDPEEILKEVEKGFSGSVNFEKILDRREAIKKALILANQGDTIILTGKGSESWMCVAEGKKIHWNEKEIVLQEFSKII